MVGGQNITYTDITVSNTDSAGVYVASEWSYNTHGVDGVRVDGGTVTNANTNPATVHGAILLYAGNTGTRLDDVTITNLTVVETPVSAGRIFGMITENGATFDTVVFSNLALQQAAALPAWYANAPASSYRLISILLNGAPVNGL
ncbi:hypothetical protein [Mycolicibacterium frederiksbergense]|uniref:hypothetical protein n=1 Tax=Mycolicibacterium frederiksbergense TaxID=117567 RepID=UPI00265C405F|nr:hypothetical protein [Mycolicibacterium frederiksbergense]MDO0977723.1 hypothetical protein [Mycolicibacterium frederiksbergense]